MNSVFRISRRNLSFHPMTCEWYTISLNKIRIMLSCLNVDYFLFFLQFSFLYAKKQHKIALTQWHDLCVGEGDSMSVVAFEMLVSSYKNIFRMVFMDALEFGDNGHHFLCNYVGQAYPLRMRPLESSSHCEHIFFVAIFFDTAHSPLLANLLNFTLAHISIHSKTLKMYFELLVANHRIEITLLLPSARANPKLTECGKLN